MRSGSVRNAGGMLPRLPAQQQLQSTDLSLQGWLHPGERWQVMQKYVLGISLPARNDPGGEFWVFSRESHGLLWDKVCNVYLMVCSHAPFIPLKLFDLA